MASYYGFPLHLKYTISLLSYTSQNNNNKTYNGGYQRSMVTLELKVSRIFTGHTISINIEQ